MVTNILTTNGSIVAIFQQVSTKITPVHRHNLADHTGEVHHTLLVSVSLTIADDCAAHAKLRPGQKTRDMTTFLF
jgi:hypothetical protein